jgi:hypothetical protein
MRQAICVRLAGEKHRVVAQYFDAATARGAAAVAWSASTA